jgi:hypothetical protein
MDGSVPTTLAYAPATTISTTAETVLMVMPRLVAACPKCKTSFGGVSWQFRPRILFRDYTLALCPR